MPRVTIIKTHFVVKNMHGDIQQSLTSKIKLLSTFGITLASICQLLADIACNCPAEETSMAKMSVENMQNKLIN